MVFSGRIAYPHITLTTWGRCPLAIERLSRLNVRAAGDPIIEQYAIDYVVVDEGYASAARLGLENEVQPLARFGAIVVHEVQTPARVEPVDANSRVSR